MQLRIATYNIHKCRGLDGRTRPERIAAILHDIGADIVAVQEILGAGDDLPSDQVHFLRRSLAGYHCVFGENRKHGSAQYGNWGCVEFLSEHYGNGVVKSIWNKAAAFTHAPDMYSTQAISSVLKPKGGFKKVYAAFTSANVLPAKFYSEGKAWPSAAVQQGEVADFAWDSVKGRVGLLSGGPPCQPWSQGLVRGPKLGEALTRKLDLKSRSPLGQGLRVFHALLGESWAACSAKALLWTINL